MSIIVNTCQPLQQVFEFMSLHPDYTKRLQPKELID